jgi:carboxypeptidase PM20D1
MIKRIAAALLIVFAILVAVIAINTFRSPAWPVRQISVHSIPLPDSALEHFIQAIRIPTISSGETARIDTEAFRAFGRFIDRSYPLLSQMLTKFVVNQFNYIYEWEGQDTSLPPFVLMGHYDVVPVEAASNSEWKYPPFSGAIADSCIWGRGSVDDKSGVIAELESAEALLKKGFVPRRSIYLCFGHDEEISGKSAGMEAEWFSSKNIHPELVLDEGGEITEEKIKEVKRPVAAIGVGEKGYASFELSVEKEGGHSSMPDRETAIDILVNGLAKLRSNLPPERLTPPVREFLERISSASDHFLQRAAGANLWLFHGLSIRILCSRPEGNAMIRTTLVPTVLQSGIKDNVIPSIARAVANCRILPGDNASGVQDYIRRLINDERIRIERITSSDLSPLHLPHQ